MNSEIHVDLAHILQLLKRGGFSVCVWGGGGGVNTVELTFIWMYKINVCFAKVAEHLELSSGISLLAREDR